MENDPVILSEEHILLLDQNPTIENPVMSFATYKVVEKEYEERVRVERSVQKYRPQWKFFILGMSGAFFAGAAGNTNLILTSVSAGQQIAFNVTAAFLAGLSFTNMEPVGEPIFTGETQLQRRSGTEIITDTLRIDSQIQDLKVDLDIFYSNENVFSESDIEISDGTLDLNLATFLEYLGENINAESSIDVRLAYNGFQNSYTVPVTEFLSPYVTITSPVAILRNAPNISELNVVTEVGEGSSLQLINRYSADWYQVQFGGSEVFVARDAGVIQWMSEAEAGSPDVFEFADVPFGEIDVENSVPVLRENNPNDRAIILTNGFTGTSEPRQYLERDHDLMRFYFRYALQMRENQIYEIQVDSTGEWMTRLDSITPMDTSGTLFVFLSGSGFIDESNYLYLEEENLKSGANQMESEVLPSFDRLNPSSLILMADLDFKTTRNSDALGANRNSVVALQEFSDELLRKIPNSAIIFSHRPGQQSNLYIGSGSENKRHHIFSYYLADALKKRNTEVADIVRYLENNIDYTSRRLHDRPQEIQVYGNLTINLAD